jgi:23S rRNA (guanosine2251-2'-O)-methyltransferase
MAPRKTRQNHRPKGPKSAVSRKRTDIARKGPEDSLSHEQVSSPPRHAKKDGYSPEKRRAPRNHDAPRNHEQDQSQRHGQKQNGLWLYGIHAVTAALANPKRKCLRLLATPAGAGNLTATPIAPEIVDRDTLDDVLPYGAVHQGLALLTADLPSLSIEDVAHHAKGRKRTVVVVLDQVTDPQNIGATLRSAAAFGAFAVIVPDRNTPEATGAMAKAASGALETVPLIRPNNLVRALETLKTHGFWVVGLDMDAPSSLPEADLPDRCVLALGAEGRGLRRLTRETCDMMVRVPMTSRIESLNVSASAAVALYEWCRMNEPVAD